MLTIWKRIWDRPIDSIRPKLIEDAAATIMRYLEKHPESADTVEGVADWWLARQRVADTLDLVNQALEQLAEEGLVRKQEISNGRYMYTLNSTSRGN